MRALWLRLAGNVCRMHTPALRYRSELCPRCNAWRVIDAEERGEDDPDPVTSLHVRRSMKKAALVAASLFLGCASSVPWEPSPEKPRAGCIVPSLADRSRVEGKLLPELVLVIGSTSPEDGERWMTVRGPEWDFARWEPHTDVVFGAQCSGAVGITR